MPETSRPKLANTLSGAVLETGALFDTNASSALEQALEILKFAPGQAHALALAVCAFRLTADRQRAREFLERGTNSDPALASAHYELGLLLSEMGDIDSAIASFSRVVQMEPGHPNAWRCLGDVLSRSGKMQAAADAYAKHFLTSSTELKALDPATRSGDDRLVAAEAALRERLRVHPTDVTALRMLAGVYLLLERRQDAEDHLAKAVELSPSFSVARWLLAQMLSDRNEGEQTLAHLDILLREKPDDERYLNLKADQLMRLRRFEEAVAVFETLLSRNQSAENWMYYGHALKAIGRQQDCILAYRKAIALRPAFGQAYWSLANMKTFRFDAADVEAMRVALHREDMDRSNHSQMHFALGKALEDAKEYAPSFEQYQKANVVWRKELPYDADANRAMVCRAKAMFTAEFYRQRAGFGCSSPGPIFIVGLPRSGSTLVEQILSSHSMVEGIGEVTALNSVAEILANVSRAGGKNYPEILKEHAAEELKSAGKEYLERTLPYRTLRRTFFVDKMPSNFHHMGLLLLLLPNAKVIDARRHPLGTGFANFKQFFAHAQSFAFDLADIGRYYRDYVELMAHFDSVLPGRIHRLCYEQLITDTESEIRRLLAYCDLPFEETCLRFHETKRGVLTASSEQVREPIFSEGMDQWHNFEPWLGPLKATLGDVLVRYPEVPLFESPELPVRANWGYRLK